MNQSKRTKWSDLKLDRLSKLLKRNMHGPKKPKHKSARQKLNAIHNFIRAENKIAQCADPEFIQGWRIWVKGPDGRIWVKGPDGRKPYIEYYFNGRKFRVQETLFRNYFEDGKFSIC